MVLEQRLQVPLSLSCPLASRLCLLERKRLGVDFFLQPFLNDISPISVSVKSKNLTLFLFRERSWNLLFFPLGNVEQDARSFDTRINRRRRVRDVANVVTSSLQLHDVALLQVTQMRIAEHVELDFRIFAQEVLKVVVLLQNSCDDDKSDLSV